VVWIGFDLPQEILANAAGGAYAAPVWADFVRPLYFGTPSYEDFETGDTVPGQPPRLEIPLDWERPEGFTTRMIDMRSGKLGTEWCPEGLVQEEIFLPGTEPTELCDLHAPGIFGAPLRGLPQLLPDTTDTIPPVPADTGGGPPHL